jgi:sugar O-acyltransferase (sialic acid O-acetyltransferase NeuD family)
METDIVILGKGDAIVCMILDNLYSNGIYGNISIYNNLSLPILREINHPDFNLDIREEIDIKQFKKYVLGVYDPKHKIKIIEKLNPEIEKFHTTLFNDLVISKTSKIGIGCLIHANVSVGSHTNIENFVSINRNVSIGHHTNIGNFVSINPGCNIAGNVNIGEGTLIGMGTNVLNTVQIGKNTIIGAGSNVTRDIPDNVVAYGNPCKIIRDN